MRYDGRAIIRAVALAVILSFAVFGVSALMATLILLIAG